MDDRFRRDLEAMAEEAEIDETLRPTSRKRVRRRQAGTALLASGLIAALAVGALLSADVLRRDQQVITPSCHSPGLESVDTPAANRVPLLRGVQGLAAADAWAVGVRFAQDSAMPSGLMMHWDGRSWTVDTSVDLEGGEIRDASASAPENVWAVGSGLNPDTRLQEALALHHDGEAWTLAEGLPAPGGRSGTSLTGVDAVDDATAWAVGSFGDVARGTSFQRPFALRWRTGSWDQVKVPGRGFLLDVTATQNEAWAVGGRQPTFSKAAPPPRPVIVMWDGETWRDLRHPFSSRPGTFSTVAFDGDRVWVGGNSEDPMVKRTRPFLLVYEFAQRRWTRIDPPEGLRVEISDLAPAGNGIWVAGKSKDEQPFVGYWNGRRWTEVHTIATDLPQGAFDAVDVGAEGTVWAVGMEQTPDQSRRMPFIVRKCP